MADLSALHPGMSGTASVQVTPDKLATAIGSGNAEVFASPMLIALMEAACVDCVERHLPAAHQSLGTHLDVHHTAPTPPGATVTARATLTNVEGRRLTFALEAEDGTETVGKGTHTRIVVDTPRFKQRLAAKSSPREPSTVR